MKGILTTEEKQYLRRVSNYLNSMGMSDGNIEVDMDSSAYFDFDNDIDWEYITHFSNNYRAEIPEGLIPILKKIASALNENGINNDTEEINWERLEFDIDTEKKEISANHLFSYYGRGDSNSVEYDSESDIERFDRWMDEELAEVSVPNNGILTLRYNGSGDSGYIENSFEENNDKVPAAIEDWCYTELERNFGGWEINEGSDGEFIFNLNDSIVTLNHTYNTEENSSDTLYEESFEF
jgi:hypothetical protein